MWRHVFFSCRKNLPEEKRPIFTDRGTLLEIKNYITLQSYKICCNKFALYLNDKQKRNIKIEKNK